MTQDNTGGPAFPPFHNPKDRDAGMTLRDYFAGQALAGIAAMQSPHTYEQDAQQAYKFADAMIKNREKSQ